MRTAQGEQAVFLVHLPSHSPVIYCYLLLQKVQRWNDTVKGWRQCNGTILSGKLIVSGNGVE